MDNQARWHTNIRLHDPQQLIQIDGGPFMDMAAVSAASVMRRPSAIVPASSHQGIIINSNPQQQQQQESSGGRSSGGSSDDPKWEAEFLQLFWEEEKRRAQHKGSSKVRKKRVRTPEQKAIEAARKRLARAKEKETLTEAERLERNRKRRLRERMNRYRKLNKIPTGSGGFSAGMLDLGAGSMQHHMDGKQV